jgi:hypothetical protein
VHRTVRGLFAEVTAKMPSPSEDPVARELEQRKEWLL